MPRKKVFALAWACALVLTWNVAAQADFVKVPFTYNANLQGLSGLFPSGSQTYYGVPFSIPTPGANYWASTNVSGSNPIVLAIPVNIPGITQVYTLINTFWGQPGTPGDPGTSLAYLTFTGSAGATYTKYLYGNSDIRDYSESLSTNSINGTTTRNAVIVVDDGIKRLDMQFITLPAEFATQTLSEITLTDIGASGTQRSFLAGLTVEGYTNPIPLPSTLLLLGSGLAGLWGFRRL